MKILIPASLTEVSMNAVRYAYSAFPNHKIHVLLVHEGHSTREPFYLKEGMTKEMVLKNELREEVLEAINSDVLGNRVSIELLYGETLPVIINTAKEYKPDYIVMGTRDKYDLWDKWIGTISVGVVKAGLCPTILVPKMAKPVKFRKILVSTNYESHDANVLQWLLQWNIERKAFVKFLNVQTLNDEFQKFDKLRALISDVMLENNIINFGFSVEKVKSENIVDTLLEDAYNFKADMIIGFPQKQPLWKTLFFTSVSKKMILQSKIPLMFINEDIKSGININDVLVEPNLSQ